MSTLSAKEAKKLYNKALATALRSAKIAITAENWASAKAGTLEGFTFDASKLGLEVPTASSKKKSTKKSAPVGKVQTTGALLSEEEQALPLAERKVLIAQRKVDAVLA